MCEERKANVYSVGKNAIKFQDSINFLSMSTLMDVIDMVIPEMTSDMLTIYWSSGGGAVSDLFDLVDYINGLPEDLEIRFVINGIAFSGGAFIIFELITRCSFQISDYATLMIHTPLLNARSRENTNENKVNDETNLALTKKWSIILKKCGASNKIIKEFEQGVDCYFTGLQFNELLDTYFETLDAEFQTEQNEILIQEVKNRGLEHIFKNIKESVDKQE